MKLFGGSALKSVDELRRRLEVLKPALMETFNVKEIGIFGSYVRGEQREESDLDVLVEFSSPIGLFRFIELEDYLSRELGVKVDLVMRDALKRRIRERIIGEVVYA
jgi:predicted nucleotidyltransferase